MLYLQYKITGGDEVAKEMSIDKTNEQPFCVYSLKHNRDAMQSLTKSAYYLYTYLVQNQDGYTFTLRRKHVMDITGLSKTSYYEALQELIDKHYIIESSEGYEFYECPYDDDL